MSFFKAFLFSILCLSFFTLSFADEAKKENAEKMDLIRQKEIELEKSKYKDIKVVSELGKEVNVHQLYGCLLKHMAPSEKFIHSYTSSGKPIYAQKWHRSPAEVTNEIPVINGYYFGFIINIRGLQENDSIMLRIVDTLPHPIEVDGKKEQVLTQMYRLVNNNKAFHMMTQFDKKEEKQLMQYGTWKKEIYNKDQLIYSEEFNLVPPSAEEKQWNEDYEKYIEEKRQTEEKKRQELQESQKTAK